MPDGVRMLEGRGEALPLDDASQDLCCFMFSLHHIPVAMHDRTVAEVIRVLKPGGRLHVVEPLPESCAGDPMSLVDDETEVRTRSHARLHALPQSQSFALVDRREYRLIYHYDSFEHFIDSIVRVDPARAAGLAPVRAKMERLFHAKAKHDNGRFRFDEPCRAYHFRLL